MTEHQLSILRHALGLDSRGKGRQYRNHFVTGPGSDDFDSCTALVASGLMIQRAGNVLTGGDPCFVVTPAGVAYVDAAKKQIEPPLVGRKGAK